MKYVDLHCDTATRCFDEGQSLLDGNLQISLEKLKIGECAAQCFAIFTQGGDAALCFENYLAYFLSAIKTYGVPLITDFGQLERCISGNTLGAILTVENLGFLKNLSELDMLSRKGVKMASLVWNFENDFAYPNLNAASPDSSRREVRGLKPLGKAAVEILDYLKIIIDVSHLSDGGTNEILKNRKIPIVASHSNADAVCKSPRNLTDAQIKKISDCGGVVGINFSKNFLGASEDVRELALRHLKHIINVGGESVPAIGGDFDGITPDKDFSDCTHMPDLFEYLQSKGISAAATEKICHKNFLRVFKEV